MRSRASSASSDSAAAEMIPSHSSIVSVVYAGRHAQQYETTVSSRDGAYITIRYALLYHPRGCVSSSAERERDSEREREREMYKCKTSE